MGYQDRPYYRDRGASNPLLWLVAGSVPLFTVFGIRVRAHASMIIMIGLVLLLGVGQGFTWQDRVQSMSMLFAIVLLHEFGHCFAARWVGGDAEDILMYPLGGLAYANPPRRPLPTFLTVAAGPAVNVLICAVCTVVMMGTLGKVPWNPYSSNSIVHFTGWSHVGWYAYWIYLISLTLLIFNLLPIYPLDGGQMLQTVLWPPLGYYRSMNISCIVGMIGAIFLCAIGLATLSLLLVLVAASGFLTCLNMRRALKAAGPEEYADSIDYSAAYENFSKPQPKPNRRARWAAKRAIKIASAERQERVRIDQILAKVSAHGMHSLGWRERRALKKATEHQRRRDMEKLNLRRL